MVRLPADVVLALRRRAATAGVTLGEAARQLMLARDLGGRHGALEHLAWLHDRLLKEQKELEDLLGHQGRDMTVVKRLLDAIASMREEWQWAELEDDDGMIYSQYGLL